MWIRFFTAALCLLAFLAELALDPSTPFVRLALRPKTGQLLVVKKHPLKRESLIQLTQSSSSDSSSKSEDRSRTHRVKIHSTASHAAVPVFSQEFVIFLIPSVFQSFSVPPYTEPIELAFDRPPIA